MTEVSPEIPETAEVGPRLPWMKFWVSDLLTSSFVLSLSELDFARYVKLLFRAWDSDTPSFLPNDVQILARFAGASSLKSFKQTWAVIGGHFTRTRDGKYVFNSKERLTFQKQIKLISNSIQNGKNNHKPHINQQTDDISGIPTAIPAGIPSTPPALARGLQDFRSLEDKEEKLSPPPSAPAHPEKNSGEREIVERTFAFYIATFGKNPKKYQLTDFRRQKASLRFKERLKANDGNEAAVEQEFSQCVEVLAASDFHRANGFTDWDHIFRSQEMFEKRLNWNSQHGGNGHVNGNGKKPTIVEAQLAELQRFTDKRNGNGRQNSGSGVAVGHDDRQDTPSGSHGRVDREPGPLLAGEADWGL